MLTSNEISSRVVTRRNDSDFQRRRNLVPLKAVNFEFEVACVRGPKEELRTLPNASKKERKGSSLKPENRCSREVEVLPVIYIRRWG